MAEVILGISAYYHDSAAALLVDGELVAAAQEERFTRIKHDASFPHHSIQFLLDFAGIEFQEISAIVFYEKPFIKFERLLETYHAFAPQGLSGFLTAIPVWVREKLFMKKMVKDELLKFGESSSPILFTEHHLSHAASAFFPSPFVEAAILTIDGVGEWDTLSIGKGKGNQISILKELHFPHSLGLLYSAFTYYLGFEVNGGEYKLMGLAPYGDPDSEQTRLFKTIILEKLIDIRVDGSFLLNMEFFNFGTGLTMTKDKQWEKLFGIKRRQPESELLKEHCNLALAAQQITEEVILSLARTTKELTGCENLVLAGGVALNCVANGKIHHAKIFEQIWVQPAAGDAGGSIGAALSAWFIGQNNPRVLQTPDAMKGAFLGPEYSGYEITRALKRHRVRGEIFDDFGELSAKTATLLAEGNIVGWFQGRMEFGPRALGNRSILGDPRNPDMQKRMNLKIKYREGFRPFAPSVLEEDCSLYFDFDQTSPYMLFVAKVNPEICKMEPVELKSKNLLDRLYFQRSNLPAITHIDYSARLQTVSQDVNARFYRLLTDFRRISGIGMLVNTSFNVRDEPIVCSPDDAILCFLNTEMDYLVLGDMLISKSDQQRN